MISFSVGSGIGPEMLAPVRLAVSTIRLGAFVEDPVVESLESDSDFLV